MNNENYIEMKKKAVRYYNENKVPQQLEELLNVMFMHDPDDIYGYLSEYFGKLAKPVTISQIMCRPTFNIKGYENVTASVSCCVNGVIKHVLDLPTLADNSPIKEEVTARMKSASEKTASKNAKKNKKDIGSVEHISRESLSDKPKRGMSFGRLSEIFQHDFIPMLLGCDVNNQSNVDNMLRGAIQEMLVQGNPVSELMIPTLVLPVDVNRNDGETVNAQDHSQTQAGEETKCSLLDKAELYLSSLFSSLLVATTSAKVKEVSLYRSLMVSLQSIDIVGCGLPLPALSVITCDPSSPGKLMMIRNILISPKLNIETKDGIISIMKFSSCLEQALITKFGASGLLKNTAGRYTPPVDKIDQVFELLTETTAIMNIVLRENFDIIIDVDGSQLYDEEKSRYEIVLGGSAKTSDSLIEMYKDWVEHYPIIAIIDGLADKDEEGRVSMFREMSPKCSVYSSEVKKEYALKLVSDNIVNGIVIQPEKTLSNLTDLFSYVSSLTSVNDSHIMIMDEWCTLQNDTAVVDLGVALNASYILVAPINSFKSLSRLLQIYFELYENNELQERTIKSKMIESSADIEPSEASLSENMVDEGNITVDR